MKIKILMLTLFLFLASFMRAGEISFEKIPEGEAVCDCWQIFVNDQEIPVYQCRVSAFPFNQVWPGYQRPIDQTETAGFAYWDMNGSIDVQIKAKKKFKAAVVRPDSRKIVPEINFEKNLIRFKIDRPGPLTVEIDGYHNALHLFPSAMRPDPVKKDGPHYRYFGPGVHRPGIIEMTDGDTVYIDAGAVVYGSIHGKEVSNIKVLGRGVLDQSNFERGKGGGAFKFVKCKNIYADGLVLRDSDVWTVNIFDCDQAELKNLFLIGQWRYNADGIDVCNSRNISVENCFVRSFDDSLVVKGLSGMRDKSVQNLIFRKNVIWCDWGRAIEIGAETCAPKIENILFEDCDIIRTNSIALDIQHGDRAEIKNIRFVNIRVEIDDNCLPPVMQRAIDQKYDLQTKQNHLPALMVIGINRNNYSQDKEQGTVSDVLFRNINVYSKRIPHSRFAGLKETHDINGIVIENLRINDRPITKAEEMNLHFGSFVKGVIIK